MLEELHPMENARLQATMNTRFRNLYSRQAQCLHKYSQSPPADQIGFTHHNSVNSNYAKYSTTVGLATRSVRWIGTQGDNQYNQTVSDIRYGGQCALLDIAIEFLNQLCVSLKTLALR